MTARPRSCHHALARAATMRTADPFTFRIDAWTADGESTPRGGWLHHADAKAASGWLMDN